MPCVLTCSLANMSGVLTCSNVNVPYLLTCSCTNVLYALTCSHANVFCVLMCSRFNVPCVFLHLRDYVPCRPTSSRSISTNNKNKNGVFSLDFWCFFLCSCPVKWFCFFTFLHFSHQMEAFNKCYDSFCAIKCFHFLLSGTLRDIFKWLINWEWWIIASKS